MSKNDIGDKSVEVKYGDVSDFSDRSNLEELYSNHFSPPPSQVNFEIATGYTNSVPYYQTHASSKY